MTIYEMIEVISKRLSEMEKRITMLEVPMSDKSTADTQLGRTEYEIKPEPDPINHPRHYQARGFEVIDIIEAYGLNFRLGNACKYLLRAGKKDPTKFVDDLHKARWYIDRELSCLENKKENP